MNAWDKVDQTKDLVHLNLFTSLQLGHLVCKPQMQKQQ